MLLTRLAVAEHPSMALFAVTALYIAFQGAGLWMINRAAPNRWAGVPANRPGVALAFVTYAIGCVFCMFAIIGWLTVAGL
jgi:hypothetical protein